jgi:hypothetical protein
MQGNRERRLSPPGPHGPHALQGVFLSLRSMYFYTIKLFNFYEDHMDHMDLGYLGEKLDGTGRYS